MKASDTELVCVDVARIKDVLCVGVVVDAGRVGVVGVGGVGAGGSRVDV